MPSAHEKIKKGRVESLIKELAAAFLQEKSNRSSLITVTNCGISDNLRSVTVFVSVFPETAEESALNFLKRRRKEFREYVRTHARLRRIPFVDFEIDGGEKNRRRIDEISSQS